MVGSRGGKKHWATGQIYVWRKGGDGGTADRIFVTDERRRMGSLQIRFGYGKR